MHENGQEGDKSMHYLTSEKYTYLAGEINALYHEAAVKMGVSDSVQNILYVICEKGDRCLQSDISKLTGISRQTINSAIRKLEKDGIVYLEQGKGRNTIVCLTEKGKQFASEKIYPLYEIENKIWNEWTAEEQEQYLLLTQKYRDALKKYLNAIL
ncbi:MULTISPECIES: MarR family winged helix-turn-helix transcriptional regulator [Sellimonas]|nr:MULTISPECIES: MarR family transcriptional regulator [Sellimonas]